MKFFQKHKNKIFALCLAAVLLSCFMGFSISSSADVVNDVTDITVSQVFFTDINDGSYHYFTNNNGTFSFIKDLGISTPTPCFSNLNFYFSGLNYTIPSYTGRPVSLSVNIDFDVLDSRYLYIAPSGYDILRSCIFNGAWIYINFTDGTGVQFSYDTFVLRDSKSGEVLNWNSADYWNSIKGYDLDFDIYVLFDVTAYLGKTFNYVTIIFPNDFGQIYYSNNSIYEYLVLGDIKANFDFAYSPFDDVVLDDLSDISGSLSGVNNKLDSISSSMNTIDQDINRVNQTVSDLRDDLTQGDPDIQSSNSDILSSITDVRDEVVSAMESDIDKIFDDINGAGIDFDPFKPDVPILSDFWAREFIWELWGFFKSQSIFYTFIHVGMLLCFVCFVLRR